MSSNCVYPLDLLVTEICERAGLPSSLIDVSQLVGYFVEGFAVSQQNQAFTFIEELARIFLFDPSSFDGMLHFIKRGDNAVALTIDPDDVVLNTDEPEQSTRFDTITVPRVLDLIYFDVIGALEPDKQTSERSADTRSSGSLTVSTSVLMSTDNAAQVAVVNHKAAINEQRGTEELTLPSTYLELVVGSIVQFKSATYRVVEAQIDDGVQHYKLVFDKRSAWTSDVEGFPIAPERIPALLSGGPTFFAAVDSHIIADRDDSLGIYIGISGEREEWQGALVELSVDGGETFEASDIANIDTGYAELSTAMTSHPREYPDEQNVVDIEVKTPQFDLVAATLEGTMNRANLVAIGDELINFMDVEEISPGTWRLSGFLRGRKGSPISAHSIGERVVFMRRTRIAYIPAELWMLNRELVFRVTTIGEREDAAETHTITYLGRSQIERQPAYLQAHRDDSGNVVLSWQGVGRLGGGVNIGMGTHFAGFRVTVGSTVIDTQDSELTTPIPGSPTTVKVQQLNEITGAGPAIEVTV